MKTCSICKTERAGSDFRRCNRNSDGLQAACKDCQKAKREASTRGVPIDPEQWGLAARMAMRDMHVSS